MVDTKYQIIYDSIVVRLDQEKTIHFYVARWKNEKQPLRFDRYNAKAYAKNKQFIHELRIGLRNNYTPVLYKGKLLTTAEYTRGLKNRFKKALSVKKFNDKYKIQVEKVLEIEILQPTAQKVSPSEFAYIVKSILKQEIAIRYRLNLEEIKNWDSIFDSIESKENLIIQINKK